MTKSVFYSFLGKYKVICYYTNWSWYRQGEAKYGPSDIDLNLCTHILYGFATLDPNTLTMRVFDSWSDTDEYGPKLYAKVTELKKHGIKVLIALGGWNDSRFGVGDITGKDGIAFWTRLKKTTTKWVAGAAQNWMG